MVCQYYFKVEVGKSLLIIKTLVVWIYGENETNGRDRTGRRDRKDASTDRVEQLE